MNKKQTITTKSGITYERKMKDINYDTAIYIRVSKKQYDSLRKIAKKENITLSVLVREILEDYLEEVR